MNMEARSRLQEFVSKPAVRIVAGAVALGGTLAGCGGDDAGDVDPGFTPDATHTLTIEPTATRTPIIEATPTFTPTPTLEPTFTPTPEPVVEVPCKVLPIEFCKDGKLLEFELNGKKYSFVGLNVPPGTPIYALTSGELAKTEESGQYFTGFGAQITNSEQTGASIIKGDVLYQNMVYETVQEGQQIATVGDRGIENLGGYNIVFTINRRTQNGPVPNMDLLKELFPNAFEQPPIQASISVGTPANKPSNYIYVTGAPNPPSK